MTYIATKTSSLLSVVWVLANHMLQRRLGLREEQVADVANFDGCTVRVDNLVLHDSCNHQRVATTVEHRAPGIRALGDLDRPEVKKTQKK